MNFSKDAHSAHSNGSTNGSRTTLDAATIRPALRCSEPGCQCQRDDGQLHCPAHDDKNPSLSLREEGGKTLWKCHAECSREEVTSAILERCGHASNSHANGYHLNGNASHSANGQHKARPDKPQAERDHASGQDKQEPEAPPKTPSERGLSPATLKFFEVETIKSEKFHGWKYPTFHADSTQGRPRFKYAKGKPKYKWWPGGDGQKPAAYNVHNIPNGAPEVWAVGGEPDVWTMHQAGLVAIAPFGETQGERALVEAVKAAGVERLHIALDNDSAGHTGTAKMAEACKELGQPYTVREFKGASGHDVCDEFERQGRDREKFRAAMIELPEADAATVASWGKKGPQIISGQSTSSPPTIEPEVLGFSLDEIGNGKRFASQHGAQLRFCETWGAWAVYRGGRWQSDEHGEAEQRAKVTARSVAAEAVPELNDDRRARLLKHALTLTKRATRDTMLRDAASEPGMRVTPEQFDADPNLFNLANGTLDLRTLDFRPHSALDLLTLQSPVAFDERAACPTWRACMARWMPDEPTRDHVQDAAGASLSGVVFDEFFIFLYGDGDNGKSTFLKVLEWLLGTYSHKTQAETLMQARDQRQPNAPSPELLALKGARLVTAHEIDTKHTLNATLIKDLTGRDTISARGLFEKRSTIFEPQFTLWMFGNGKPQIKDTSGGMWRRPRLIDFGRPIPPGDRDPLLGQKLRAELPGILNWALEGLQRVHERGLIVPDAVRKAVADYRAEQDALAGFLKECCVLGPEITVNTGDLWAAWGEWCHENGEREGSQRAFGAELTRRKFERKKSNGKNKWRGIGLLVEEDKPTQ
jgi:P4 family phage/plasmid primase-like protien